MTILYQFAGCNSFHKLHCFHFFPCKSVSFQNNRDIKYVKVIIRTSFDQTTCIMGWSPKCYIQSSVKIGPPVLEKNFEQVSLAAMLSMSSRFVSLYSWRLHIKSGFHLPSGFREIDH